MPISTGTRLQSVPPIVNPAPSAAAPIGSRPDRSGASDRVVRSAATAPPTARHETHGVGIGLIVGGAVEGGVPALGAGANVSAGAGVFYDGTRGLKPGAFAEAGGFAELGARAAKFPHASSPTHALGGFAGVGYGVFVTNASSAKQLAGVGQSYSLDIGLGPKFSAQLGIAGDTFAASVTIGPGIGLDASTYPTRTVSTPK